VPSIVIYDASVLYPSTLRDLLLRVAQAGLIQAKWTEAILDEAFAALRKDRPDLDPAKLDRTRALMATAVRDWRVDGYEDLIPTFTLPDPDDRHVLAAAVHAQASTIVTANLRHFPAPTLGSFDVQAVDPDNFILAQLRLDQATVETAIQHIANSWRRPPGTIAMVLASLERAGLTRTVTTLRAAQAVENEVNSGSPNNRHSTRDGDPLGQA
jgi:predicted nucleic acid-binding protein